MQKKFLVFLEDFCSYLKNIKQYSSLTIKTYHTPIKEAIYLSDIYEENNIIFFNITKYRLKISMQSNKTINKKLSSIRSFISYLINNKNLNITLHGATSVKSEQTLPKPIEKNDIYDAIDHLDIDKKILILLIYSFGLRISEVATLEIKNIKNHSILVDGKGSKQREIPANNMIWKMLQNYIALHLSNIYLFEKNNKPLSIRQLQYKVDKIFKTIGLKVTPHQLRHSFATDLLNNGARIIDISELLGHSSLKATKIYTKLNTNTKLKQYNSSHPLSKI